MQIQTIIIATLAAVATAMPGKDDGKGYETGHWGKDGGKDYAGSRWGKECKPIAYECTDNHNKPGWNVCNTSGKWEVSFPPFPSFWRPSASSNGNGTRCKV